MQKIASSLSKKKIDFTLRTTLFDSMYQLISSTINYCIPEGISLMTMHAAKGLEFNKVILPFWVDGNVPYAQQYNYNPNDERRLAFVSLTRARQKVVITFSEFSSSNYKKSLRTKNEPSLYIEELVNKNQTLSINFEDLCTYNVDNIRNDQIKFFSAQIDQRHIKYSKLDMKSPMIRTESFGPVPHEKRRLTMASNVSSIRSNGSISAGRDIPEGHQNAQFLSNTPNEIDEIDSIFLKSLDELVLEDVKKLMNNKLVKKKSMKDLFIRKIRHMNALKRMTIPVSISCGNDTRKPLSKCNSDEVGQYLLRHLD